MGLRTNTNGKILNTAKPQVSDSDADYLLVSIEAGGQLHFEEVGAVELSFLIINGSGTILHDDSFKLFAPSDLFYYTKGERLMIRAETDIDYLMWTPVPL